MTGKACQECHRISNGPTCPHCKTSNLSDDFTGLIIIINPKESSIAKAMKVQEKGRYALRVRWLGIRKLPSDLRITLKRPLGTLLRGSTSEIMSKLKRMIKEDEPTKIIAVGDVVSENLVNHNISLNILIVDNRVMRKEIPPILVKAEKNYHIRNPPGTLTDESWNVMEAIIPHKQLTKVIVEGEEDLLALVAILTAPYSSYVIYGQPHQGIVVVKVNKREKDKIRKIVDSMEELPPAKN